MRSLSWISLILAVGVAGCGKPDYKQIADDMVREQLSGKFEKREAIKFFEERGKFFDIDATTTVDRDVVLPLLKRLREIEPMEQWVILKPEAPDSAAALLVELPHDAATVDRMAKAVEDADDGYSGFIVQQWGRDWLSVALIDQSIYEVLKKANPEIDKQR